MSGTEFDPGRSLSGPVFDVTGDMRYINQLEDEIKYLCGALEHTLRFSSLPYKWPEQAESIREQIYNARILVGDLEEERSDF